MIVHWESRYRAGPNNETPYHDLFSCRIRYRAESIIGPCSDHLLGEKLPVNEAV